jgi:hypothetical protein
MDLRRVLKIKIGQMLIERNLISQEQLDQALAEQREKGGYISQHLISLGFVNEIHIADCLASQYGFAYIPLPNYEISPEVLKLIPFQLINIYSLLPLEKSVNYLEVVMADPLNEGVIDMLRQITNCDIQVLISTYSQIRQAISTYFPDELSILLKKKFDTELSMKKHMLNSFIQVKTYSGGKENRKYMRKEIDLDMVYFLRDKRCIGKIKNISYGGLLFLTDLFVPVEINIYTNIVCKIFTEDVNINAVVKVVRVEKISVKQTEDSIQVESFKYSVAGFFNFITDDDRLKLTMLLQ